jgi:intracellular septation protein A
MALAWWWYPKKRWTDGERRYELRAHARTDGFSTEVWTDGVRVSADCTPLMGPDAIRNHHHRLPDGAEVEAGFVGLWAAGAVVRRDGRVVHETHPGRKVAYPERYVDQTVNSSYGREKWERNRLPIAVDIGCSLLFYVLAKTIGLTEAALIMAGVGVALYLAQLATKLDFTGGLALFGIAVSLASAGFAWVFQDPEIVKLRGTVIGSAVAILFLIDGLLGGRRLAGKLVRYMPYEDMDPGRFGIGLGVTGLASAALNYVVAKLGSTDFWLLYTTFLDVPLAFAMMFATINYARGKLFASARPVTAERV